jgi:hypothetical protein
VTDAVFANPVGDPAAGVIQFLFDHLYAFALVEFGFDAFELGEIIGRQIRDLDRKVRAVHLLEQFTQQLAARIDTDVDMDIPFRLVDGLEKGISLDMVPVAVR